MAGRSGAAFGTTPDSTVLNCSPHRLMLTCFTKLVHVNATLQEGICRPEREAGLARRRHGSRVSRPVSSAKLRRKEVYVS